MNARIAVDASLPLSASDAGALAQPALYERVAERLRRRIFAHEIAPGSWIDEQSLTAELGISRTPLREALKVLAAEGLVVLRPRRGCYVAELSENDLDEVFPVIAVLEAKAAGDAANRASDADIARLDAIHAELKSCAHSGDIDGFFAANQSFHAAVQDIAGNRTLKQLIEDTRKVIRLTRRDSLRVGGRVVQSLAEHQSILDALRARDAKLAAERMHDHLLSGRAAVSRLVKNSD